MDDFDYLVTRTEDHAKKEACMIGIAKNAYEKGDFSVSKKALIIAEKEAENYRMEISRLIAVNERGYSYGMAEHDEK